MQRSERGDVLRGGIRRAGVLLAPGILAVVLVQPTVALATTPHAGTLGQLGQVALPDVEEGEPVTAPERGASFLLFANTGIHASLVESLDEPTFVPLGADYTSLDVGFVSGSDLRVGLRSYASMDWSWGRHDRTVPYLALSPLSHDVLVSTGAGVPSWGVYRPGLGIGLRSKLDQGVRWTVGARAGYAVGALAGPMAGGTVALEVSDRSTTMDSFFLSADAYVAFGDSGGFAGVGMLGLPLFSLGRESGGYFYKGMIVVTGTASRIGDRATGWTAGLGFAVALGAPYYGAPFDPPEEASERRSEPSEGEAGSSWTPAE